MFANLVPAALRAFIVTLFRGEREAVRLGLVASTTVWDDIATLDKRYWTRLAWLIAEQVDLGPYLVRGWR